MRFALAAAWSASLAALTLVGCRRASSAEGVPAAASVASAAVAVASAPVRRRPRLELHWDPATGKGDVVHHLGSGDLMRTCFHCGFEGYTGGLVIGAHGGSGMGFYPSRPIRGHRQINVLCAQDESIWDRDQRREYTYGWSENFGTGPDGERLEFVAGRVLEQSDERLVLAARNEGGCYRVDKIASSGAGERHWILATRITNRCERPIHFDFFTGDDPWLGLYRTAAGDVGWTPNGIVHQERAFVAGELDAAGLYDLGNAEAGEREGEYTGQANFFALDPALPLPDFAAFANGFAHGSRELVATRALDDKTMTALNLGWRALTLRPGEGVSFALAVGLAEVGEGIEPAGKVVTLPKVPAITLAEWSRWRASLDAERGEPRQRLDFAAERVEMTLSAATLLVKARYLVENHGEAPLAATIRYPVVVDAMQAPPSSVAVDGLPLPTTTVETGVEVRFPVTVPARSLAAFEVEYEQALQGRRATYLVTSALSWDYPIGRAELVVRYPASLGDVRLSYPASFTRRRGDTVEQTIVRQPFLPDREVVASW